MWFLVVSTPIGFAFCLGFPCILGLLLFLVYMNDLVNVSLSQGYEIVVFADDILMFKPISSDEDLASFQADIALPTGCLLPSMPSPPEDKTHDLIM